VKQVIIDAEAENELSDAVDFYENRKEGLGLEFERVARASIQSIQESPTRYPPNPDGTRRLVMKRFPFVIHYLERSETIWILAFAHKRRKPGYWRERLG
jgi:hypothetical protein